MSWRARPAVRIVGSAVSWFGLALCISLLLHVALIVMALGGSCAEGGAYEIAVECPEGVAALAPLSIWGGLASVAVWIFFAGGFGTPIPGWAWFVLFGGLSIPFSLSGDPAGLIVAAVFFIMGIVPIGLELRANPIRTLIGTNDAKGNAFLFADNSRRSLLSSTAPLDGVVEPNPGHWLLGLGVPVASSILGALVGVSLY